MSHAPKNRSCSSPRPNYCFCDPLTLCTAPFLVRVFGSADTPYGGTGNSQAEPLTVASARSVVRNYKRSIVSREQEAQPRMKFASQPQTRRRPSAIAQFLSQHR